MSLNVSVIATVLNESNSIGHLLDSLASQTRMPDEVVIVDGGSTDGTLDILERYAAGARFPLRVLSRPGANISQGRNAAIYAAKGPIIASTDAGVRLAPEWLEELVQPFEQRPDIEAVAGFFAPAAETPFEVALGATVLPTLSDIEPATFLPSSRSVAFKKAAWEAIGGYPEWLDYCEDLILDLRFRDRYGPFAFAPKALVYFRPRRNLGSFFLQYYRYARGDGKADLWRKRHAIRYLTYGIGVPGILFLALWHSPIWLVGYLIGGALYTAVAYRRLVRMMDGLSPDQKAYALAMVPCIRVVGDIAKMIGYPVGWIWRLRHWREIPR